MGIINRNQGRGTSVTSGGAVYRSLEATVYGLVSQEEAEDTSELNPILIDKDLKLWAQAADPGEALPEGGTTGQVLAKASDDDYDVEWIDASEEVHGIPSGGSTGQVLKKASGTDYDAEWGAIPNDLPSGGTTGQVLVKTSNSDYAVGWDDQSGGSDKPIKAINFSQFNSGNFSVTYQDNTIGSFTVNFDSLGNPTSITDGSNYLLISW